MKGAAGMTPPAQPPSPIIAPHTMARGFRDREGREAKECKPVRKCIRKPQRFEFCRTQPGPRVMQKSAQTGSGPDKDAW